MVVVVAAAARLVVRQHGREALVLYACDHVHSCLVSFRDRTPEVLLNIYFAAGVCVTSLLLLPLADVTFDFR